MELIIDIPQKVYDKALSGDGTGAIWAGYIKNGKPLPKGHGRLIDADELKTLSYEVLVDTDNPNRADGLSACNGLVEDDIDLAPTIIEADKGGLI